MTSPISIDTKGLHAQLKQRSVRGGINSFVSQGLIYSIRIAFTAGMARLILPEDFGLVSMVTALTHLADQFRDLGLSQATIQKKDLHRDQVSAVFWINVIIGGALTLVLSALAPLVARFYHEPKLIWVTVASSLAFLFSGFTVQPQALLQRQLMYGRLAVVDVSAVLVSSILGLWAGYAGMKHWAVVVLNVSYPLVRGAGLWWATRWNPSFRLRGTGVRSMLRFGAGVSGFNILNYFSRNLDRILIGRYMGTVDLGYYTKAYQLLLLPISQLRTPMINVGIPALSALQNDPVRYRRYYRSIVALLALASMPLVMWMIVCSEEIVRIFLGPRWISSARIFSVLGIVALVQAPASAISSLPMLTMGKSRKYFLYGVMIAGVTTAGFLIGIRWGTMGVVWSYVATTYLLLVPTVFWGTNGSQVSWRDAVEAVLPGVGASAAVLGIVWWLRRVLLSTVGGWASAGFSALIVLFVTGCVAVLLTAAVLWGMPTMRSMVQSAILSRFRRGSAPSKKHLSEGA